MTNKRKISRAEISQEYGLSEYCVKMTATKYGLEVVDHDGREFLYDREDAMEVFGWLYELRRGNRNVVFRLPKICTASDLADILDISMREAKRYIRMFPYADVRMYNSNCLRMSDDIWREVLR